MIFIAAISFGMVIGIWGMVLFAIPSTLDRIESKPDAALVKETPEREKRLSEALERASEVMNHFGDVLNDMDCVDAVEKQTGVPNDRIDEAFKIVRAALAKETPDA